MPSSSPAKLHALAASSARRSPAADGHALAFGLAGAAPLAALTLELPAGLGAFVALAGLACALPLLALRRAAAPVRSLHGALFLAHLVFWLLFARLGALAFALFLDHVELPPALAASPAAFIALAALLVLALAPATQGLLAGLERRRSAAGSAPVHTASAFILLALACFALVLGMELGHSAEGEDLGQIGWVAGLVAVAVQIVAGVIAARSSWTSLVREREARARTRPLAAAAWLACFVLALAHTGLVEAPLTELAPLPGALVLGPAFGLTLGLGLVAVASAVGLFLAFAFPTRAASSSDARPRQNGGDQSMVRHVFATLARVPRPARSVRLHAELGHHDPA
ncbi:hypothetical protein [Plesiocystis pacifica]|uniref:hypothetical protein n=1 Tax=Plesiocystis pacifica TaxID=191768 RepID=UPI0012F88C07|nr:hypothetical protein [Plesiocystis pacifica]